MSLNGKKVVVLGGSSGIGLATAQAAAREGAAVVIASSRRSRIDQALATLPGAVGHALDLTEAAAVEALFAGIGAFDHLVFTAGESLMLGSLAETDLAAAQRFFALRYWGAFTAAKFGHPHLRPGGSITAAQFLQRFVDDTPWAHLDIAGTAMGAPKTEINQSWGSGYGVRLLERLVAEYYETRK